MQGSRFGRIAYAQTAYFLAAGTLLDFPAGHVGINKHTIFGCQP